MSEGLEVHRDFFSRLDVAGRVVAVVAVERRGDVGVGNVPADRHVIEVARRMHTARVKNAVVREDVRHRHVCQCLFAHQTVVLCCEDWQVRACGDVLRAHDDDAFETFGLEKEGQFHPEFLVC